MKYFNQTFPGRLIQFLSHKTGYTKRRVSAYAFFLLNLFEKIGCIYDNEKHNIQNHFNKYIKLQKHNKFSELGVRLTHNKIAELIYYTIEDRSTIAKMINELTAMGYISRRKTGTNVNRKGQVKKDASFNYKVNLKKLIQDMDSNKLLDGESEKLCLYKNDYIQYYGVKIYLKETFGNPNRK